MVVGPSAVTVMTEPSEEDEYESTKSESAEFDDVIPHLTRSVNFATKCHQGRPPDGAQDSWVCSPAPPTESLENSLSCDAVSLGAPRGRECGHRQRTGA